MGGEITQTTQAATTPNAGEYLELRKEDVGDDIMMSVHFFALAGGEFSVIEIFEN